MSENENPTASPTPTSTCGCRGGKRGPRGRGRRFAARALGLSLLLAAGAFAFRAFGQGPRAAFAHGFLGHGCAGGACTAADVQKHVTRAVGWLVDDVKGTPEQEAKLTSIATAAAADLLPLKEEARRNHLEIARILTQEKVDRAALEAVRARQIELATAASTRLTKAVADAADVLTPAQRVELASRLAKRVG
jgi:Spy/CpxP family protein refolding chaperone